MEAGLSLIRSLPQTRNVQLEDHRATIELAASDEEVAVLLHELVRWPASRCGPSPTRIPRWRMCS